MKCLSGFLTLMMVVFLTSCGENYSSNSGTHGDFETGSCAFSLNWPEGTPQENDTAFLARVDCTATGIATIIATVYNSSGQIMNNPPNEFSCQAHNGQVSNLSPGTGYRLQIDCENASGDVIYTGELTGIEIIEGQTTRVGEIQMVQVSTAPTATINSPGNNSVFSVGEDVNLRGWGNDGEDGVLNSADAVSWSSSIDGELGVGENLTINDLTQGTHTITLTVTDSDGNTGTTTINITVNPVDNTLPVSAINTPADNATYVQGDTINFSGTGTDAEDGTLTGNSLVWTSSIDGQVGTGQSVSTSTLATGTHTITLTVTDSSAVSGTTSVTVIIEAGSSGGNIIRVPYDQSTIQAGIDAASDSDTVLIADGTYTGDGNKNLDFKGKAIIVQSENGPTNCIIDCENEGLGFYFHTAEGNDSQLVGVTVTNGYTGFGGGIRVSDSSPTIDTCFITNNETHQGHGGGVSISGSSSIILKNSTISNNNSEGGGGGISIFQTNNEEINVINCHISGNTAISEFGHGGGVLGQENQGPITFFNCTIKNNISSDEGGGLSFYLSASVIIDSCIISNNEAEDNSGGGISAQSDNGSLLIRNSIISDNTTNGVCSGICGLVYSISIVNSTISRNSGGSGDVMTLGDTVDVLTPIIKNSIVWNNSPSDIHFDFKVPDIIFSNIEGGFAGEGNINQDPLFAVTQNGDYRLSSNSPCIDTGTSTDAPATDIEGTSRPQGSGYDMGAYEYH